MNKLVHMHSNSEPKAEALQSNQWRQRRERATRSQMDQYALKKMAGRKRTARSRQTICMLIYPLTCPSK